MVHNTQVMVYLRHPNIVTVMGAVVQKTAEPLMVMENMKHGSLFDLLHNTTMRFDGDMLMTMLDDIVSGMNYLHSTSPPVLHNDLKTGNVLVGANFQVRNSAYPAGPLLPYRVGCCCSVACCCVRCCGALLLLLLA